MFLDSFYSFLAFRNAKNYETVSTFVKVMQKKNCGLFFPGHGVYKRNIGPATRGKKLMSQSCVTHMHTHTHPYLSILYCCA